MHSQLNEPLNNYKTPWVQHSSLGGGGFDTIPCFLISFTSRKQSPDMLLLFKLYFLSSIQLQFARLFAKLPWPGDSEVIIAVFESSCHLLLSV